jgi:Arc/MetJ-type ribon-helix-helix transcriptional regulator
MAEVRKISVSMPPDLVERVKLAAAGNGESVSGWLVNAALRQLEEQSRLAIARIEADRLVAEHEEEFGPIPAEVHTRVDEFIARAKAASGATELRDVG